MVGKHDEVVDDAGEDGEMTHVVGVELAYGLYLDIEFFGLGGRVRWRRCLGRSCGLGGVDQRAVIERVGGGEACTGSVVTCFYGYQLG